MRSTICWTNGWLDRRRIRASPCGRVHCIFRDEDGCGLRVCVGQCIGSGGSRCSVFMTNLRGLLASKDVRQKRPCYTIGGGCNPITACDHWWCVLWLFLYSPIVRGKRRKSAPFCAKVCNEASASGRTGTRPAAAAAGPAATASRPPPPGASGSYSYGLTLPPTESP